MQLELINFELELKISTKNLIHKLIYHFIFFNSEIFLSWQSNLEYKLLGVGIPSGYSGVPAHGKK